MISGDADLIFCGSDCHGILEQAAPLFPAAKPFETYVQPDTGHGMNLHYNASGVSYTLPSEWERLISRCRTLLMLKVSDVCCDSGFSEEEYLRLESRRKIRLCFHRE